MACSSKNLIPVCSPTKHGIGSTQSSASKPYSSALTMGRHDTFSRASKTTTEYRLGTSPVSDRREVTGCGRFSGSKEVSDLYLDSRLHFSFRCPEWWLKSLVQD